MLVGEALALGQFAFGVAEAFMGNKAQEQQIYNEAYKTTFNNAINEYRTEQQNKATAEAFGAKIDFVKNQIENNYLAAEASWVAEQMRLNEIYDTAAYKSESMRKMLVESMGANAAREVYGKSARRGALVSTLGAYGRSRAQLVDSLLSQTAATEMRMQRTEEQFKAQNKLAISQVSVIPTAATFSAAPMPGITTPGFAEQALQIGGIAMGAFTAGVNATPADSSFFGIKKKT